jgi:uncharacterized protein YgiM (DUF1202 family)
MKLTYWIICGALLATGLSAQQATNAPAPAPSPTPAPAPAAAEAPVAAPVAATTAATNAPAAKTTPKKKPAPKKKKPAPKKSDTAKLKTVPLVPGPAVVIASNVNVRAQGKLKTEVITKVQKGQTLTVVEEVTLKNSGPEEPSAWAKILLPPEAHVWVNTAYIDPTNKTVLPKKLNVRSGPGENYSVLGRLVRGDYVKEITAKNQWLEIEAPTNAYGFVAAQYLTQAPETPAMVAAANPSGTPPTAVSPATATTLGENPTVAPAPAEPPVVPAPAPTEPAPTNVVAANAPAPEPAPVVEEPPPKRIVQREGFVRGTTSIQAPTKFELVSLGTRKTINYLYSDAPGLDLHRYKGMHIIVTGEEGLDERWLNTPIIEIQRIQVVE